jgi:hypothetical protein
LGIIKLSSHLNVFQATKPTTIQLQQKIYPLIKPMELIGEGAVLDGHGATLTGNGSVGIHVGAFGHVTVKNVTLSGFATGIFAQGASDLTLSNVTITNVQTGVRLEKITEGLVQAVAVHAAKTGVQLSGCTKLIVDKTDLSLNSQIGMDVSTSSNCILRDNKINRIGEGTTNGVGLSITNASDHNQILRNTVVHCTGYGINFNSVGNTPSTDNTFDGNDISWTTAGTGFNATQEAGNFYLDNTAGFCRLGLVFTNVTNSQMKGNLCVGNTEVGIKDVDGSRNTYENNVFVMENGSQLAFQITSSPNISSDIRLYQNIFQDYQKPIRVENASPLTLQSNVFGGVKSTDLADIASVVGRKPLALSSEESKPKPSDFVLSNGPIAMVPSIYDRVGGISISSSNPGIYEVVVEGSLTGLFQGEEQVFASYKGEMPVDMIFPPRFSAQVRTRVIAEKPTYFPFSALLGDNSMAKDHPADDSGDTLFKPAIAVDGDTTSIDHAWQPPKGKAGEWWEVDLKSDQIIDAVSILAPPSHPNDFWGKFHISVSSSGLFKGEEKVVAVEVNFNQTPGPQRIYRFPATVGRYVRIYGDQDQTGVQLQQVGVYGIKH